MAAPIFLLADYHIFHFAKVFLKTQNLPSSISLLMSLITNFYLIKHSEFIHGLKETCIVFIAEALHFTDKNPRHKDKFFNLIFNFPIKQIYLSSWSGPFCPVGRYIMTNSYSLLAFDVLCPMEHQAPFDIWGPGLKMEHNIHIFLQQCKHDIFCQVFFWASWFCSNTMYWKLGRFFFLNQIARSIIKPRMAFLLQIDCHILFVNIGQSKSNLQITCFVLPLWIYEFPEYSLKRINSFDQNNSKCLTFNHLK